MLAVALFAVAMAVRLVHVWAIRGTPLFDVLMGDARAYDAWAQRIAGGDWVGTDVFYQAPLYPYFLGTLYALAGRDLLVVRIVQAAIGSAAAVLLADAGTRLFSRRVGLLAGFGLALYAPAVFFDGLLQKSVLDVFFVCLSIWCASRLVDRPRATAWWLGLGLGLGALSLTRENALALVFVAVVWAAMNTRKNPPREEHEGHEERHDEQPGRRKALIRGASRRRRPGGRQSAAGEASGLRDFLRVPRVLRVPVIALLLGIAVVLLPVVARNYAVTGGVYLTTSQFGPNFYIGNNPASDGTYASLRPGRGAPEYERQDATELAERALQRTLTPAEVSSYWTDRALTFIAERPGDWLALMARKVALLWNAGEMLDTESQETYEDHSPLLRALALVGHFGTLVPLAIVGLVAAWPDRQRLWPIGLMFAGYAASVAMFYVFARYRFPLVPFLLLFAAAGVASARALLASATPGRRAILAGAVGLAAVAVNWPMLSPTRMRAITETNLGSAFHEAGRYDEAVAHYERAVALEPDYAPAYSNLGVTLRAQGRVEAAIAAYEKGLALEDDFPDLHYNLANALLELGRADEAARHLRASLAGEPASAASHNNLGMALAAKGQYAQAAMEFRAAIALEPASVLAHRNLGNVLASMDRTTEALAALERATALDPKDARAAYDLGSLLLEAGRFSEAAARFEAALALDPRSVEALNNLGIALASQGRLAEAVTLFERALAIQPDFADAQQNLATARGAMRK